jgi:L-alanine-DL-glutamate epimerase-like enolase superfamily enzyme
MRIRDIRTIPLKYTLPKPLYDATFAIAETLSLLVEVETDDGLIGLGEAAHLGGPLRSTQAVIDGELRDHLLGEDPRDIERLWEQMYQRSYKHARGGILIAAMSGIDIALWDLRGKMAGMPLWRLLGGYRRRVPAYAGPGLYAEGKGIKELCQEMEGYAKAGFRAVKMKVGRNSDIEGSPLRVMSHRGICEVPLSEDLARVRAVRDTIGPDVRLMVDANGGWDVPTAVKMARAMEPLDIYWLEEPVWPDDLAGSAEVASKIPMPVAGYETGTYGKIGVRDYIAAKAVHFVQFDVAWAGGLTDCLKAAHLAQVWNLPFAPHIFGSAVAVAASVHLLGALPNASMAEASMRPQPFRNELVKQPIVVENGCIELPERPGLGIELDYRAVEKYRADT